MSNKEKFLMEISRIVEQPISQEHFHPSSGRFYYIQAPEKGAPMLLHHYRGPFFIDIHPDDYRAIVDGQIDASEYIKTANWLVGYYWGGGSMISGGYYQPIDLNNTDLPRYLKILACRGQLVASGYEPTEKKCQKCAVNGCPLKGGFWSHEPIQEEDPRVELFYSLRKIFEEKFPGFSLRGFTASDGKNDAEIIILANSRYDENLSFRACASEKLIRDLLMRKITPEEVINNGITFTLYSRTAGTRLEATEEAVREAFEFREETPDMMIAPAAAEKNKIMQFFKKII